MQGETNLDLLLASMKPKLNPGQYVFCSLSDSASVPSEALFFFRENDGITIVCDKKLADGKGYPCSAPFAWITLEVHSSLEAVGLTAAFSGALAKNNISCNVVAGFYHDHIFVQFEKRNEAMLVLQNLSNGTDHQ
jgi:hypothetical protein